MAAFLAAPPGGRAAPDPLLPDLLTLAPSHLKVETDSTTGQKLLRFTNTAWNRGPGPLELRGEFNPASGKSRVYQRIYRSDGSVVERFVGEFVWHQGHNHMHFEDFARYELWSLKSDGSLDRVVVSSGKVTFCIRDTTLVDPSLSGAPRQAVYVSCGQNLQGMSIGWGDSYFYDLEGQAVDITPVPDGKYALKSTADPHNLLWELNDGNNAAIVVVQLRNGHVTVVRGR